MQCPQCGCRLEAIWKLCPACGAPVPTGDALSAVNVTDSVVKDISHVQQVFHVGSSDATGSSRNREREYEDYVVLVLKSGGNLERVRPDLERIRGRLDLSMKQVSDLEASCATIVGGFVPIDGHSVKESSKSARFLTSDVAQRQNQERSARSSHEKSASVLPPFSIGDNEFDYANFFNDLRHAIRPDVPDSGEPDGHAWYRIPAGISGAHFEWYFEFSKWRRLGVELHFETHDRRWNQAMLSTVVKYSHELEQKAEERVYVQRNWGTTPVGRDYISLMPVWMTLKA